MSDTEEMQAFLYTLAKQIHSHRKEHKGWSFVVIAATPAGVAASITNMEDSEARRLANFWAAATPDLMWNETPGSKPQ